jgi:hypothetical protein
MRSRVNEDVAAAFDAYAKLKKTAHSNVRSAKRRIVSALDRLARIFCYNRSIARHMISTFTSETTSTLPILPLYVRSTTTPSSNVAQYLSIKGIKISSAQKIMSYLFQWMIHGM